MCEMLELPLGPVRPFGPFGPLERPRATWAAQATQATRATRATQAIRFCMALGADLGSLEKTKKENTYIRRSYQGLLLPPASVDLRLDVRKFRHATENYSCYQLGLFGFQMGGGAGD